MNNRLRTRWGHEILVALTCKNGEEAMRYNSKYRLVSKVEALTVSVVCTSLSPLLDYRVFWLKGAHDRI